jgi:hypothetical protein
MCKQHCDEIKQTRQRVAIVGIIPHWAKVEGRFNIAGLENRCKEPSAVVRYDAAYIDVVTHVALLFLAYPVKELTAIDMEPNVPIVPVG